jgi:hypothetical protein
MRNFRRIFIGVLALLVGLFVSCGSQPRLGSAGNPCKPLSGVPNATVVGPLQKTFETVYQPNKNNFKRLNDLAYNALLEAARQEYSGNIDVVDISWIYVQSLRSPTRHQYSATGKVVSLGGSTVTGATGAAGVEGALARAARNVAENFTPGRGLRLLR